MVSGVRLAMATLLAVLALPSVALELNAANRSELEQLPRIGVARAEAILKERDRNGPFRSWEDFQRRVPGYGAKSIEHLKARGVTIDRAAESEPEPDRK